jgi:hypothetical protein
MRRHLLIIARRDPLMYEPMRRSFAGHTDIEVILDRRRRERRWHTLPTTIDRREKERRSQGDYRASPASELGGGQAVDPGSLEGGSRIYFQLVHGDGHRVVIIPMP